MLPASHPTVDPPDLSPEERQDRILVLLGDRRRLPVAELARHFRTSEDSIRRDLRHLASAGRIRRVHGAVLPSAERLVPFEDRGDEQSEVKARIAVAAAAQIRDGMTVLVDGGTTVLATVRALAPECRATLVTTSTSVAEAAAVHPGVAVVLIGGTFDKASRTVVGAAAVEGVRSVRADVCLLGLCSIDPDGGVTAVGYEEAQVKRAMIEAAATVLAVATPDKLGRASSFQVAPATAVGRLVTGADANPDAVRALSMLGIDVLTV
ncbi:MAG TPA: DeoR/GlpR family DNA-binding transcription regulator [Methylomirabilota bacterium]|nr:DeoR/GlpR family DNA-binding transcription regulator [Methylomirabilota bacterium]